MPFAVWLSATRPKTLPAAIAPVAVGTALASTEVVVSWPLATGCLAGALLIQIATNFANDAFDGIKGTDAARIGPRRAVAAGLISARAMLVATGITLALALAVGLWLAVAGGWPVLVLGLISLACAVAYTAGPFPLAYVGLGDLFVLLFFGWFAVLGSAWVQVAPVAAKLIGTVCGLPLPWWLVASAVGLQAAAIIAVNNLRDLATDALAGKRTLCVRLGDRPSRMYYGVLHAAASLCLFIAAALTPTADRDPLVAAAGVAAIGGVLLTRGLVRAQGSALNPFLGRSAALELLTAAVLAVGLGGR
jgi:1,4-dihydroxy-2-naphthoate octaprenyltransferase